MRNALDFIRPLWNPRRSAFERAIRSALPRRSRRLSLPGERSEWIERLSSLAGLPEEALLESTATRLGVSVARTVSVPSEELIRRCGFSREVLERARLAPFECAVARNRYGFVTADPDAIDLTAFRSAGIPVLLGLGRDVRRALQRPSSAPAVPEAALRSEVRHVLVQVTRDAAALGASEVFLGHPHGCSYEFRGRDGNFAGMVHQRVVRETLAAVRFASITFCIDADASWSVTASLTKNFESEIVCLTWDEERSPASGPVCEISARPTLGPNNVGASVLLVDDDDRFALAVSTVLQAKGYVVTRKRNGREALDHLATGKHAPAVIVCDVHMPVMDGRTFLAEIRRRSISTPVVMLTADEEDELQAEAAVGGADAFIEKRRSPQVMLAWIQNALARSEAQVS